MSLFTAVLLTLSLHSADNSKLNNKNLGIGIEYTNNLTYGVYRYNNSYGDVSTMVSVSKQWEHFGLGLGVANGYSKSIESKDGIMAAPEVTIKFNDFIRVRTTYPSGFIADKYDVVNLQFTYNL